MLQVNAYFDDQVKSIGFENGDGRATVGVMAPGEYEFGTSTVEIMTVISGQLDALLPGEESWKAYGPGASFTVEKDIQFKVKCSEATAYHCLYK